MFWKYNDESKGITSRTEDQDLPSARATLRTFPYIPTPNLFSSIIEISIKENQ